MTKLAYLTLRTSFPCCYRRARFRAIDGVPIESYLRRCVPCETTWSIRRETIQTGAVRMDRLDWLDTATRLYTRQYGER